MFRTAFATVLLGCVLAQPPPSMTPAGKQPSNPALPGWLSSTMGGCKPEELLGCMRSVMGSTWMRRGADMRMSPAMDSLNLDVSCGLIDEMKECVMPKVSKCGQQAMSAMSAVFKAVEYICVDARNETEKYMKCMLQEDNAAQFGTCVTTMVQEEMSLMYIRDPNVLLERVCGLISRYEVCLEKKAGNVCNEEALMTNFFNILNKGLSFLNCPNLGSQSQQTPSTVRPRHEEQLPKGHWEHHRPGMGQMQRNMRCIQGALSSCMAPTMALMARSSRGLRVDVDAVCSALESNKGCIAKAENTCGSKARHLLRAAERILDYLCLEKKEEFKEVANCLMKDMFTSTVNQCVGALSSLETRGDFIMEDASKSEEMTNMVCRAIGSYGDCITRVVGQRCGYRARDLVEGMQPEMYDIMGTQLGVECLVDEEPIYELPEPLTTRRHRHRMAMLIALPIAGVVLGAIIAAIVVFVVRRRRGTGRRQQQEKADLVKNDLLQQNLRFAITQTPKEKSQDGLKV